MDVLPFDPAACLASAYADAALDDLRATRDVPRYAAAAVSGGGWSVLVIVTPASPGDGGGMTACEQDCLALLARADRPLSAAKVREAMEGDGLGIHGATTVKRALRRLHRLSLSATRASGRATTAFPNACRSCG